MLNVEYIEITISYGCHLIVLKTTKQMLSQNGSHFYLNQPFEYHAVIIQL